MKLSQLRDLLLDKPEDQVVSDGVFATFQKLNESREIAKLLADVTLPLVPGVEMRIDDNGERQFSGSIFLEPIIQMVKQVSFVCFMAGYLKAQPDSSEDAATNVLKDLGIKEQE